MFTRVVTQLMRPSCMDPPIPLYGYCRKYTKITYPTWKPVPGEPDSARKKQKKTLRGNTKSSATAYYCVSAQCGDGTKNYCSVEIKTKINVTETSYSTRFRCRKPRYEPAKSAYRHHRQVERLPPAPIYGYHR